MEMDVFKEIKKILMEILDLKDETISRESYLMRDLGAESVDLLELATALNAVFKVEINEEAIFLKGLTRILKDSPASFPFLRSERLNEIASDLEAGPPVKVEDLVSYVTWQLEKETHGVP